MRTDGCSDHTACDAVVISSRVPDSSLPLLPRSLRVGRVRRSRQPLVPGRLRGRRGFYSDRVLLLL